jgi:hypothetical protein
MAVDEQRLPRCQTGRSEATRANGEHVKGAKHMQRDRLTSLLPQLPQEAELSTLQQSATTTTTDTTTAAQNVFLLLLLSVRQGRRPCSEGLRRRHRRRRPHRRHKGASHMRPRMILAF